jgi:TetR/AcrR family transcriptional regulator, tetracycline repressor protein
VGLDAEVVVRAALQVLDAEGFDGLTVRRIAERLGVQNPALYWHFKNKQEIVDRMAERLLRDALVPAGDPEIWEQWLRLAAHAFRSAMLSHRDGARVLASADLSSGPMPGYLDQALAQLIAAGFRDRDALVGLLAIFDYTLGSTFEEQADPVRQQPATPAALPSLAAKLGKGLGPDDVFDGAVQLIIDGLRGKQRQRPRRPARASPGR